MKYDCAKTLDCIHELRRLCYSHSDGCDNDCPLDGMDNCNLDSFNEDKIALLQKWSDEHPEPPKLTKREYEFLTTFVPHRAVKKAIERIPNKGLYIAFYSEMNDEVDGYVEGYAEGYLIDPNLFEFIKEGERWYFEQLFDLEVEEKNETDRP